MADQDNVSAPRSISDKDIPGNRAVEVSKLLTGIHDLIIPFIRSADEEYITKTSTTSTSIVSTASSNTSYSSLSSSPSSLLTASTIPPSQLQSLLSPTLPITGLGATGLLSSAQSILNNSINTFSPGFLDKLYSSTDAAGLSSELLLAALNTNTHVYNTSPALTILEKVVSKALANLFGLEGKDAGGVTQPGGSASNLTSLLVARNERLPSRKKRGLRGGEGRLVSLTSRESHYSVTTAASILGLGSDSVYLVPVDDSGAMSAPHLSDLVSQAKSKGEIPFYVNATAGTTVRGSYDPFPEIAEICEKEKLWFHIDASWGGPAIFSSSQKYKLKGSENADSIAINPHKMMGVPITCSFLLGKDMTRFLRANAVDAGYLFHGADDQESGDVWDMASYTPQCGRKGDSLKFYLAWIYYGSEGFEKNVDRAFEGAKYLADVIRNRDDMKLVWDEEPACCQVCFYYVGEGDRRKGEEEKHWNTRITRATVKGLVPKGWMIDFAPGEKGEFFRVVVNRGTTRGIADALIRDVAEVGRDVVEKLLAE